MPVIYEPSGKAREYSPLACNLYLSCTHMCKYCYAPHVLQRKSDAYFIKPHPRKDILKNIEAELKVSVPDKQIMLSFIGDVYSDTYDNNATTRAALELFLEYGAPVAALTKGGNRCLRDIDLFKAFGNRIQIGTTLTFWNASKSREWESGAALPAERIAVMKTLKDSGIKTFASFEPVIEISESLAVLEKSLEYDCIDHYKIGKVDRDFWAEKTPNWEFWLTKSLELLRYANKQVYVKRGIREAAPNIEIFPHEIDADRYATSKV